MLLEGKAWIKFMIEVAMACTAGVKDERPMTGKEVVNFIRDVLFIVAGKQGPRVHVELVPYPVTTKVPLLLTVESGMSRLFWYYPTQTTDAVSEELAELICELTAVHADGAIA